MTNGPAAVLAAGRSAADVRLSAGVLADLVPVLGHRVGLVDLLRTVRLAADRRDLRLAELTAPHMTVRAVDPIPGPQQAGFVVHSVDPAVLAAEAVPVDRALIRVRGDRVRALARADRAPDPAAADPAAADPDAASKDRSMVQQYLPRRKTRWGSIVFFAVIHTAALVAAPWYAATQGVSVFTIWLTALYGLATILAINVGYHRLFSHAAFKAHPFVKFVCLFFGAATFQQSALKWSSLHRRHHQLTDTPEDPYNIKFGFWYAHMGWILFWRQPVDYANVRDLQKDGMIEFQHRQFQYWALGAGVLVPVLIGAAAGHALEALIFAVGLRMTLVFHFTFFINSYAHTFGSANYDARSSARDHWLGALLTNGEGYHNFHHAFPVDYRNGIRWYHWDPAKWIIFTCSKVGLASDLKRTTQQRIQEARLRAIRDRQSMTADSGLSVG